jgi:hypothetical protein
MIRLNRADEDGEMSFELTGKHADQLAVLLNLPIVRNHPKAGMTVTLTPLDLTGDHNGETVGEGGGDSDRDTLELELTYPSITRRSL